MTGVDAGEGSRHLDQRWVSAVVDDWRRRTMLQKDHYRLIDNLSSLACIQNTADDWDKSITVCNLALMSKIGVSMILV